MPARAFSAVLVAAGAVFVWRVAALALRARAEPEPAAWVVPALLAAVGLTFLACGLLVLAKRPGKASLLFAGFCIASGLHWGGPLDLSPGPLRTGLILFYLLVSGTLGATLLLHLALWFPARSRLAGRTTLVRLLYAPVALGAVLAAAFMVSPAKSGLRSATQQGFLLLEAAASNLFSALALVLVARHLFGTSMGAVRKRYVGLMVAGMLVAWLPYLVASAAGVENTDPWNLTVAALPVSFALAFFRIDA